MTDNVNDKRATTVAFDVDGTLTDLITDQPRDDVIALFKALQKLGCEMYIWSDGGVAYAREVAFDCDLHEDNESGFSVVEKGSFTPDICVDDDFVNAKGTIRIPV